jgi:hypothetical protein
MPIAAVIGFGIAGIGYSCIVPVLFISAANEQGFTSGTGIATVTTIGYTGFLVGPPFIGFLSEAFSLFYGFWAIALLALVISIFASLISFK